jgi:small subunit ribosomal protein S17
MRSAQDHPGVLAVNEGRKLLVGRVVGDKMQKTIVVAVQFLRRDRLYQRMVVHTKKFMVHDELRTAVIGDMVRIRESRPISKRKHFELVAVTESIATRGHSVKLFATPAVVVDGGA